MKVPYAELGKEFWIKHQSYCFSLSEIALYFYLVDSCNNGRWENPFALRTLKIIADTGLKEDSITNAKRRLKSVGLIDFDTVKGSKFSHYQFPKLPIKSETFKEGLPKNDPNLRQSSAKVPPKLPEKSAASKDTLLLDLKDKDKDKKTPTPLPFDCDGFSEAWQEWLAYKAEIKDSYKSDISIEKALNNLVKLSDNDCEKAIAIIDQSIEKGWQGLFALKVDKNAPHTGAGGANGHSSNGNEPYSREGLTESMKRAITKLTNDPNYPN